MSQSSIMGHIDASRIQLLELIPSLSITKDADGNTFVYDIVRNKRIKFLPEEMVRQLIIHYLVERMHMSKKWISVEKRILINDIKRRYDIVVYDSKTQMPKIIIECKGPEVALDEYTLSQITTYNTQIEAPYLWISNGKSNCIFEFRPENKMYYEIEGILPF